ncbi:histidine phosphatase family protein [Guptibacillus hwajinpoensis]|uniref:histidine phosphatase family protein n=1 Tax=Guptibacillus hwajinpoensis TaxID=208199 RepID=UPI0024B34D88|nr:histidine phosphatase family protein [Pseudalkalibacillus hwajinpoensis]
MKKKIYLVRHCLASGQKSTASLTAEGRDQATQLAQSLGHIPFDKLYSSPYRRALQSIEPLALQLDKPITIDDRLEERKLSAVPIENWIEELEQTFVDLSYTIEGGESSQQAISRSIAVLNDALLYTKEYCLVMTHGNLLTLILHHFNTDYQFNTWKKLRNPDVFCLTFHNNTIESIQNVKLSGEPL